MADSPEDTAAGAYPTIARVPAMPAAPEFNAGALSARLQALIGKETVSSFARKCGLAESVLRTYLKDGRMPPLDKALAIAAAAGVSVHWLATGQGASVAAQVPAAYAVAAAGSARAEAPPLAVAVLQQALEEVLASADERASPAELALRVVDLYQRAVAQ